MPTLCRWHHAVPEGTARRGELAPEHLAGGRRLPGQAQRGDPPAGREDERERDACTHDGGRGGAVVRPVGAGTGGSPAAPVCRSVRGRQARSPATAPPPDLEGGERERGREEEEERQGCCDAP